MPSIEDAADAIVVVVDAAVFATTGSRVQMPKRVGPQLVDDLRQEFRDEFGFPPIRTSSLICFNLAARSEFIFTFTEYRFTFFLNFFL